MVKRNMATQKTELLPKKTTYITLYTFTPDPYIGSGYIDSGITDSRYARGCK